MSIRLSPRPFQMIHIMIGYIVRWWRRFLCRIRRNTSQYMSPVASKFSWHSTFCFVCIHWHSLEYLTAYWTVGIDAELCVCLDAHYCEWGFTLQCRLHWKEDGLLKRRADLWNWALFYPQLRSRFRGKKGTRDIISWVTNNAFSFDFRFMARNTRKHLTLLYNTRMAYQNVCGCHRSVILGTRPWIISAMIANSEFGEFSAGKMDRSQFLSIWDVCSSVAVVLSLLF